ncbi:MAG: DUF262 domain-containing protein [Lachnospiraceae bacterium]|nr:DUF262 domain-containing protein [Lachnospiraceae bacterium]
MVKMVNKDKISSEIIKFQKEINYDTKDYTVELIYDKFTKKDFFIPDYQRLFIWKDFQKSLFIESILLGLPIPFMFLAECEDGRLEIVDGAQRIQTLISYLNNNLILKRLERLCILNNTKFEDLPDSQQRKFKNKALRIIVLDDSTQKEFRQELFKRINTTSERAKDSEVRRGAHPGPFTTFIESCCANKNFKILCPVSKNKESRFERFELVLRFFAYLNSYTDFNHEVKKFLDDYLIKNLNSFDKNKYESDFVNMLDFVKTYFKNGFAKSSSSKDTPRVRFEAIAVGVGLALRSNPNLIPRYNTELWLNSDKFKELTTSDASNNPGRLRNRVEFVRDELLR